MLRAIFWGVLALNVLFFAVTHWTGSGASTSKPDTELQPLDPHKMRPLTAAAFENAAALEWTCLEWGEWKADGLQPVRAKLAELELDKQVQSHSLERASGFWVFIPPLSDAAAAVARAEALKAAGVKDAFVVREAGKFQNAVSLGAFSSQAAAQQAQADLRRKKITDAEVGERISKSGQVSLRLNDLAPSVVEKISAMLPLFPNTTLTIVPCASESHQP